MTYAAGGALACLIFGMSLGFLAGCAWHAHFALLRAMDGAERDADHGQGCDCLDCLGQVRG